MNLIIFTDGASRGNPGHSSIGYLIKVSGGVILHQHGEYIGVATNNIAEYTAVDKALLYVKKHFFKKAPHKIEMIMDSQLVASQLAGRYKVKNSSLKLIFEKIKILEFELGQISYRNVPRAQNFIADRLANEALDARK